MEKLIDEYQKKSAAYKWMHEQEARKYYRYTKFFNISSIIITTSSATITPYFSGEANSLTNTILFKTIVPIILYLVAIFNGLQEYLKVEKIAEKHSISAENYGNLYDKIKETMSFETNTTEDPDLLKDFCKYVCREYKNIKSSSPNVSQKTIDSFESRIGKISEPEDISTVLVASSDSMSESQRIKYELQRYMVNNF
ncbi:MAG TPA: SLATT domain-containing protein [Allocoleopsis sp.]